MSSSCERINCELKEITNYNALWGFGHLRKIEKKYICNKDVQKWGGCYNIVYEKSLIASNICLYVLHIFIYVTLLTLDSLFFSDLNVFWAAVEKF